MRFPSAALEVRGHGISSDGASDVRSFRKACLEGRVRPKTSLLLRSAMSETRVVSDDGGKRKAIAKKRRAGDGRRLAMMLLRRRSSRLLLVRACTLRRGNAAGASMSRNHRALPTRRYQRARRMWLDAARYRCSECSRRSRLEAHHKVPLHKGGSPLSMQRQHKRFFVFPAISKAHKRKLTDPEQRWAALVDSA